MFTFVLFSLQKSLMAGEVSSNDSNNTNKRPRAEMSPGKNEVTLESLQELLMKLDSKMDSKHD